MRPLSETGACPVRPATPGPLKLGFVTPHNPFDAGAFSGTAARAFQALRRHPGIELHLMGPHRAETRIARLLRRRAFRAGADSFDLAPSATAGLDVILGLVASELLDRLRPDAPPVLHLTDATPSYLNEGYGFDLSPAVFAREARVAARAATCIYSSAAVARRAPADLGLPDLAPRVLPFGLNNAAASDLVKSPPGPRIELLFVGLDWTRKGGDIAVAALEELRRAGRDARLTLVGGVPDGLERAKGIEVAEHLDQNDPRDASRLAKFYTRAHLLILPTRGDCTPMVLGEALSYGTPVVATDVGGIAESIGGPGLGMLMPLEAGASEWAMAIDELTCDPTLWAMMSDAARDRAGGALTWDAWADRILGLARVAAHPGEMRLSA